MRVLVLCESMFGNTDEVAAEVVAGLREAGAEARLVEVVDVVPEDLADLDLLVVSAPTHALSLPRPESRAEAVRLGAEPSRATTGVREWLDDVDRFLPPMRPRPPAAVFDTRVLKARHWPGSASRRAARGLRRAGFHVVDHASFFVDAVTGPLVMGETLRARAWGTDLVDLTTACTGAASHRRDSPRSDRRAPSSP